MLHRKTGLCNFVLTMICLCVFVCSASGEDSFVDFSLKNLLDGKTIKSADYHGKGMIAVFGSIYCKPCIELLKILDRIYNENKSSGIGIIAIYIDTSTNFKELQEYAAKYQIRHPFLIDNINIAKQNKVYFLPTTVIVDGEGKIVKKYKGFQSYRVYEKEIKRLKARSSAGEK